MHAHNHLSTFIIAHLSMITQMFGMVYYPIAISDLCDQVDSRGYPYACQLKDRLLMDLERR